MRGKLHRFGNISDYGENNREEKISYERKSCRTDNISDHEVGKENRCKDIKVKENQN